MARIPTHADMMRHILHVYTMANMAEIRAGLDWYPRAHAIVLEWAEHYERSSANVAALVAALSPQVTWERCLIAAGDILDGQDAPSLGGLLHVNVRKAVRIRDERLTIPLNKAPYGPKVTAFAANLAGGYRVVTVDTHAAQIAAGNPEANLRIDTDTRYAPVARAYQEAARCTNLAPAMLQAVTWLVWKRLYPPQQKRQLRREF